MDIPTSCICIIVLFDISFKYDITTKFWGYAETNAEPLCVEICNNIS
jgi:hypothetical protein